MLSKYSTRLGTILVSLRIIIICMYRKRFIFLILLEGVCALRLSVVVILVVRFRQVLAKNRLGGCDFLVRVAAHRLRIWVVVEGAAGVESSTLALFLRFFFLHLE